MTAAANGQETTSASLIERVRKFDQEAWRRLSAIYGPLVYRWCRRAGLQQADASDVLQDVFRALVTSIDSFRSSNASGGFRGWLYGITRKKLADHFRRRAQQAVARGGSTSQQQFAAIPKPTETDDGYDRAIVVHAALEQIRGDFDEHNWQAFYRTAIGQELAIDVAADLGMTAGAVRQAKFRVLRRLRQELEAL